MFINVLNTILIILIVFFPWSRIPIPLFNIMNQVWFKILLLSVIVTLCQKIDMLCGMFVAIIYILLTREQINYDLPKISKKI